MNRILKILLIVIGSIVLLVFFAFLMYDLLAFKPYQPRINSMIHDANLLYKNPPKELSDIAILREGRTRITTYVVQRLLIKFGRHKKGMGKWHLDYALWTFLIKLHFNEADTFALWCYLAPYEKGEGLNNSARYHYGRDINHLSIKEIATLVVIVRAPSNYEEHPDELQKDVKNLLAQYLSMSGKEEKQSR